MSVRTRFAPSPTGYLHIGGVRTALFNWLLARQAGGQFILRIDDTDADRNVEGALEPILAGLRWLGIDWDEGPVVGGPYGPYFQSQRVERHKAAVQALLKAGAAYEDYATQAEAAAERAAAEAEKRRLVSSRRFAPQTEEERQRYRAEGRVPVIRLKMPREGRLVLQDRVRGEVTFEWSEEQDHVVARSDGTPLYHLASVVDDHDLRITHVIRGEEHLSNTPRQVFIAQALGYELPVYAHLPYVAEPGSKQKLSKRKLDKYLRHHDFKAVYELGIQIAEAIGCPHAAETFNPVIVDFYAKTGFLPAAIVNYLLLLGWSLDDHTEFLTREQMLSSFALERVSRGPSSFDPKKLLAFQAHYMQALGADERVERALPFLVQAGHLAEPVGAPERARVRRIVEAAGSRLKVAGDVLQYTYLLDRPFVRDQAAFQKRLGDERSVSLVEALTSDLSALDGFDAQRVEACVNAFVQRMGIALGDVTHAVRVAVTGVANGPSLYDCLSILGRDETVARLRDASARAREALGRAK